MTGSLLLASVHSTNSGSIPGPLTILLVIAAVGWVLWSRLKGQPLRARRLLILPVVLIVIGATDLPHLTRTDIVFLVVSVAVSVVLGAARGATIELYPLQGELWQRYRISTVVLWASLIVTKVVLMGVASAFHASAGGGTNSLLVTLGASLVAEAAVVGPRALSTGLPFAAEQKDRDDKRASRRQSSHAEHRFDVPPARQRPSNSWLNDETEYPPQPDDSGEWRSPSLRDGVAWLRRQIDQQGNRNR